MAIRYEHSEIFRHEDISKVYIASEGRVLSPKELIEKAAKEEKFDTDYADYIVYKNEIQIKEFITKRNRCKGNSLQFFENGFYEAEEDEFEPKIKAMPFKIKPTVFEILDVLIRDQQWDLVFYVYRRETAGLNNLIVQLEDEHIPLNPTNILDKKMIIFKA